MRVRRVYLMNTLIVPIDFNKYKSALIITSKITPAEGREIVEKADEVISAIGHESTAKILSQILSIPVEANRRTVFFEPGDVGIHFFLKHRLPEGKVLSDEELKKLDYWLVESYVVNARPPKTPPVYALLK